MLEVTFFSLKLNMWLRTLKPLHCQFMFENASTDYSGLTQASAGVEDF